MIPNRIDDPTISFQPVVGGHAGPTPSAHVTDGGLPEPLDMVAQSDDCGAQIAAMMIKASHQTRRTENCISDALAKVESQATENRIAALHDKATNIVVSGVIEGAAQVVAGGATIMAGCAATPATSLVWQGLATASSGAGKGAGEAFKAQESLNEAMTARAEADANQARRGADRSLDAVRDEKKHIDAVISFYREYKSAQDGAQRAALHGA